MARFTGKKIVITGASSGIGLAGAKRIIAEEGEVMITGRDAHKLARLHQTLPPDARLLQNDGADPAAAQALADAVASFGMLDGLWLNAGQLAFAPAEKGSAALRFMLPVRGRSWRWFAAGQRLLQLKGSG